MMMMVHAERDAELSEAEKVLKASEAEIAQQLQQAAGRFLPMINDPGSKSRSETGSGSSDVHQMRIQELEQQVSDLLQAQEQIKIQEQIRIQGLESEVLQLKQALTSAVQQRQAHTGSTAGAISNATASTTSSTTVMSVSEQLQHLERLQIQQQNAADLDPKSRRQSVAAALSSELAALRAELECQQAAVESMRAEAACALQVRCMTDWGACHCHSVTSV